MKIVGIGDLVVDYYYNENNFLGVAGGGTAFNILANLSKTFNNCYAYGACGNDLDGNFATNSMRDLNINVDFIKKYDTYTRNYHITINKDKVISKKKCPICGRKKWYEKSKVDTNVPNVLLEKDNLFIFDSINKNNMQIIEKLKKRNIKTAIDIGQIGNLKYLRKDEIIEKFSNKFNFVQLNERVAKFLKERFELETYYNLGEIFNSDLIIITFGKAGASFITKKKEHTFRIDEPTVEADSTGAGDLFFSVILEKIVNNNYKINEKILNEGFNSAVQKVSVLVEKIGARALIHTLYIKNLESGCYCGMIEDNERIQKRTIKKITTNLDSLEDRVLRALESEAYENVEILLNNIKNNCIVIGAGGSYAASYYASRVINNVKGITSISMYPREMIYRNNENIENVIAISYSGTSPDILNAFNKVNANISIITKGMKEKVKTKVEENINIISYCNAKHSSGRERGFLSIEGTVSPAALFAKYCYNLKNDNKKFEEFFKERINYWKNYFKEYFDKNKEKLGNILDKRNIIDLLHGDYTTTAALDMESKIVESGVFRVTLHEKKNFSHGRFISIEHYRPDVLIYLKQKNVSKYEKELLKYIESQKLDYIVIESDFNGLLAEFDLLIASQFFMKNIGGLINIDLSKPMYTEESMKIYKYIGEV